MDYVKASKVFHDYLKDYDINDGKVKLKVTHTYHVVTLSELITKKLGLSEEDIELAKLIALLHDIARFDQVKKFNHFMDIMSSDHADMGVKILFESFYIRDFIEENVYDNIIEKAIRNHNKYKIESGLTPRELLHSKIIRDADKLDNFRVKSVEKFEDISNISEEALKNGVISDEIFEDFMACKQILVSKRKTDLDFWVSILAFIFDINFVSSLQYIEEKNYINILIDRIQYQNEETKIKMNAIRNCATEYITNRIQNLIDL